jgi:hypothetical protein
MTGQAARTAAVAIQSRGGKLGHEVAAHPEPDKDRQNDLEEIGAALAEVVEPGGRGRAGRDTWR